MRQTLTVAGNRELTVMNVVLEVMQTLYQDLSNTSSATDEGAVQLRYLIDAAQQAMDTLADFIQVRLNCMRLGESSGW